MITPARLSLARLPTPFHLMERLSEQVGRPIWIKRDDLTGSATTGNKVRKLEFTLARAKDAGANVLITCGGVQSNHCRATALLGAQLGFKVHLLLRGEAPADIDGNLFLDRLAGAEISFFSQRYYNAHFDFIRQKTELAYQDQGQKSWFIPTGASDATGVWGYIRAAEELQQDFLNANVQPSHIVVATGSGGTQAGLTAGVALLGLDIPVLGMAVCDDEAYFMQKVRSDLQAWKELYQQQLNVDALSILVNDRYIGPGYAKATPEIFSTIERVARLEGIVLDPVYTGKAFHGMLQEIEKGNLGQGDIVFVHTGGLFGLLAQRDQYLNKQSK